MLGAEHVKDEKLCTALDIKIGATQQKGFIDDNEIVRQIKGIMHGKPEGMPIKNFDLHATELALKQNVWIKNVQLFFDNNEVLHLQVEQRCPVARVIESKGASYYLDSVGFKLPLSNADRANVPVFTNVPESISSKQVSTLVNIASCINADSFMLAQVAQVNMLPAGKFELFPSFGNHVVELGDGLNMADKLNRLKSFYKKVLVQNGFDAYPKISVAYAHQVLAIKQEAIMPQVDARRAVQAFDQMVKANRRIVNEDADKVELARKPATETAAPKKIEAEVNEKPPDIKNKGNPDAVEPKETKNETAPKATMPKAVMPKPVITKIKDTI